MMKLKNLTLSFLALGFFGLSAATAQETGDIPEDHDDVKQLRQAVRLFDMGMLGHSKTILESISEEKESVDAAGYSLLCDIISATPGYEVRMDKFFQTHPYSTVVPLANYFHALNLFHDEEYAQALKVFDIVDPQNLYKSDRAEYLFKKAYCYLELQNSDIAYGLFDKVRQMPPSDFRAPSIYAMGYIRYVEKDFQEALGLFEKSVLDSRFKEISSWYIMECRFMLKDYKYVIENGDVMMNIVPQDRKPHLARIISESYMVLGDAKNAGKYLSMTLPSGEKTRNDWFHSGSVMYALADYPAAIESFNMMEERSDSLGQVANYHLGYSYIKTKNKVAALRAFKDASSVSFDPAITDDAHFNYAKLAFDLNDDPSVFEAYMKKYPDIEKDDKIYSYMAVAALYKKDYAGAIESYDQIDEFTPDMKDNYMKANYLRASQLVSNGSYRGAVPHLEASAYYAGKGTRFNHLSRYWIAESYFRDAQYDRAREIYSDLYNQSALYNSPESYLITFNLAYCHFMMGKYDEALKWFDRYQKEATVEYRQDALERIGDCYFITKKYDKASSSYGKVVQDYFDADDVYPYYQAALSYGLSGNNAKKVELLEHVRKAKAGVPYYPEALYELGRMYVTVGKNDVATECFKQLSGDVKNGNYVAKAYLELGSISRNENRLDEALGYYKYVVEQLPMSGLGEDALLAIENIYRAKNETEQFVAYIESVGKGAEKTEGEKEELIFSSAEQVYLSENYKKAIPVLKSFINKYPSGKNCHKAYFYLAESYSALDMKEQACDCYEIVIEAGQSAFVEMSMLKYSAISYSLEKWDDAYGGYKALYDAAKIDQNRFTAKVGMMRSAYKGRRFDKAVDYAKSLSEDHRSDEKLLNESLYIMAKSYLAQSQRDNALDVMRQLSKDKSSAYGAEATFFLIQDAFDRAEFSEVEKLVYDFSDSSSGQTYWLAKSFIVLGDSFAERGELKQAKATFESVRDEYKSDNQGDDVIEEVTMRLNRLEEMLNAKN